MRYRTREGDLLDWICYRHYGRVEGAVEAVLEANQGLAGLGPEYEAGVVIELPELPSAPVEKVVRLWD